MKIKNKLSFYVTVFLLVVILICKFNVHKEKDQLNPYPISWDTYGYYLYLPATFIYNDPGLQNNEWINRTRDKYRPSTTFYQVASGIDNKKVIIYNVGYAIIYSPGFFIAHWLAPSLGYEADGFSKPYQLSMIFTALFFTMIGLFMLRKIALHFFTDTITAFLILIIGFGTNYFFEAAFNSTMPHNFLLTINCFIIWFTIKWHEEKKIQSIIGLALVVGLAVICRPTELIWLLVPALWGVYNKETFYQKLTLIKTHIVQVTAFVVLLIAIIFIQLGYLKYASGSYLSINYHSEGFSFFSPYTLNFLFSFKKGWLIYTPVMIFAIIGFYFLKKQKRDIWLPLILFFLFNLFVASSWENWWYAASFGQRPMVESYPLMAIPLGCFLVYVLENKKTWKYYLLCFVIPLLILLNLFQIWQFMNGIIDPERMTKKYYWEVFGKTHPDANAKQYLSVDRFQESFAERDNYENNYFKKEIWNCNFEKAQEGVDNNLIMDSTAAEGKRSYVTNEASPFSPTCKMLYYDITSKSYLWVRASVWVYLTAPKEESNSCLVVTMESKERPVKYMAVEVKSQEIQPNKWTRLSLDYLTPDIRHTDDVIKAYYWNMGQKPVLIDDLRIEAFEPKVEYE